jgi:hypothetical protein
MYYSYKSSLARIFFLPWAVLIEICSFLFSRLRLSLFHHRNEVIEIFAAQKITHQARPKVLVVITHITSFEETKEANKALPIIDKLTRTIEEVIRSFSHLEFHILIKTIPNRHITTYLPEYQLSLIKVKEQLNCEPMFVGFKAQDEFIKMRNEFNWFNPGIPSTLKSFMELHKNIYLIVIFKYFFILIILSDYP